MALEKYIVRSIAAVAAAAVAGPALAADLAVKAPQPVAAFAPSDIHGFFDVSFGATMSRRAACTSPVRA
jgi:hypothetical protein